MQILKQLPSGRLLASSSFACHVLGEQRGSDPVQVEGQDPEADVALAAAEPRLPLAILHQASSPKIYRCNDCDHEFGKRTTWTKIALGTLIGIVLFVVLLFTLAFAGVF